MVQISNKHTENIKRQWGQYNHAFALDRNGMKNPYMRPDRRVRCQHVKWWFHHYVPTYGRVTQRLSPNEIYQFKQLFYDAQHKMQHNLAKYGTLFALSGTFIYSYIQICEHWSVEGHRALRF